MTVKSQKEIYRREKRDPRQGKIRLTEVAARFFVVLPATRQEQRQAA